ncbi:MAG: aldo/keto reductase [Gammaproteobacteria bacterium]
MSLTRRQLLSAGTGLGIASAAGLRPSLAQESALIEKTIPSTGESIPVVGLGARNFRTRWGDVETYRAAIRAFTDLGGKLIDSAPAYDDSEGLIGRLVEELGVRDDVFLASKVDSQSSDDAIVSVENSLRALRADAIDLMQVQNLADVDAQLSALRGMKTDGKFRYIGVSVWLPNEQTQLIEIIERGEPLDFIQVDYAMDSRRADARLLPLAADNGIAILANLPFGRGRLFAEIDDEPLPDWAADIDCDSWAQVFLKFVVSNPSVTCVIPGTTDADHVVDNLGAARGRLPDAAMRRMMEQYIDELIDD